MKRIYLYVILLLNACAANAQKATQQVFGSFVLDSKIVNYHFRFMEGNATYGFRLYEVKGISNKKIDPHKIDSTSSWLKANEKKLNSLARPESTDSTKGNIDSIVIKLRSLFNYSDSIIKMYNDENFKEMKLDADVNYADSLRIILADSILLFKADSLQPATNEKIYNFKELIDISKSWKDDYLGKDKEEFFYLNDWNIDLFTPLFVQALAKTSINTDFLSRSKEEVNKKTNKIFFEIEANRKFINDYPVAAYIQMKAPEIELTIPIDKFLTINKKPRDIRQELKESQKLLKGEKKNFERKQKIRQNNYQRESLRKMDSIMSRKMDSVMSRRLDSILSLSRYYKPLHGYSLAMVGLSLFAQKTQEFFKDETVQVTFKLKEITVEFEDGTIKNIFADMEIYYKNVRLGPPNHTVRFRNATPISISGKFDPEKFVLQSIYAGDPRELYKYLIPQLQAIERNLPWDEEAIHDLINKKGYDEYESDDFAISLSDLIRYDPVSEIDNEDYSPTNSVVKINPQNPISTLYKENRSKILTVKVFSDFIGIRDDQPNGLVQFEASRKMNIWTKRKRFVGYKLGETTYFWILTYIEPRITLSKIEGNNKALPLDTSNVDMAMATASGVPNFHLNALQIKQYQNFNFSVYANLFKINFHNIKSAFHLNMHGGYLRTLLSDSINFVKDLRPVYGDKVEERNLNSLIWGFDVIYEIKPDSRYGFQFGYEWSQLIPKSDMYSLEPGNKVIQAIWSEAFLKTGDESKLFFRFRYNNMINKPTMNFMQIQLGLLMDVFKSAQKPIGTLQTNNK